MDEHAATPEEVNEAHRARYIALMAPLFFPEDPVGPDIARYFASLLRIIGMEDKGWDPHVESRAMLDDLYALMQFDLPEDKFPDRRLTPWRIVAKLIIVNEELGRRWQSIADLSEGLPNSDASRAVLTSGAERLKRFNALLETELAEITRLVAGAGT